MKKVLSIMLVLVLSFTMLVGCSGGPDLTEVTKKYNQAADVFNEATTHVNTNGWSNDPESLKLHNELADEIEKIKAIIEDPEQSKNIDPEAMAKDLDELIVALNEYKAAVATPFPTK